MIYKRDYICRRMKYFLVDRVRVNESGTFNRQDSDRQPGNAYYPIPAYWRNGSNGWYLPQAPSAYGLIGELIG